MSSRKVGGGGGGGGSGVGVDASTVAVINEICARALQSDVASAIAAALAASGASSPVHCVCCVCSVCTVVLIPLVLLAALTEQCLSAGQCELASHVMASLPQLLGRLVFASASYPSLQRLAVSCGLTFRNVLKVVMLICVSAFQISVRSFAFFKVMCNMGRTATESVENLWRRLRLRVCLTLALCIARRVFGIFSCSSRLRLQDF